MSQPLKQKLVQPGEGPVINVMGNELRIVLSGDDTGGAVEWVELLAQPGVGIPPHTHTREDETFLVLEGDVEFYLDGETKRLGPGATLFGPRDVPHGYQVVGDQPCRIMFTVTPATMEPMFRRLADAQPPTPETIGTICGEFGIKFLPS